MRLCSHYLVREKRAGNFARDPVAHFHLSNGARLERINWLGDVSPKGLRESAGMMVNYLYVLDQIDDNHEAYMTEGKIATGLLGERPFEVGSLVDVAEEKRAAGYAAVDRFVQKGMACIGLGTGSTAFFAIERVGALVAQGWSLSAVVTSVQTEQLCRERNIPVVGLAKGHRSGSLSTAPMKSLPISR